MLMFDGVGTSEEELAQLFTFATRMTREAFDAEGRKTLAQLIGQVRTKDIKAVLLSPNRSAIDDHQIGKLYRYYLTGATAPGPGIRNHTFIPDELHGHLLLIRKTIFYEVWYRDLELREVARIFTKNGVRERVDEVKKEAGSETLKTGEHILKGAQRAFQEELEIIIEDTDLIEVTSTGDSIGPIKPSSVYARCYSQQIYERVRLWLPEEHWPKLADGNIYTDDEVEIHQVWSPRTKR